MDRKNNREEEEIAARLEKLRGEGAEAKRTMNQKELEERLARLKGMDPALYSAPPITVYQPPDTRTDTEKAHSLLSQLMDETTLDQHQVSHTKIPRPKLRKSLSTDEQIEARLARLRDEENLPPRPTLEETLETSETMDSDEEANILMERLLAESALPSVPSGLGMDTEEESGPVREEEELPWCGICNEDARLKCLDCDGDLYCYQCFKEFHDDSDLKRHKTSGYRRPSKVN